MTAFFREIGAGYDRSSCLENAENRQPVRERQAPLELPVRPPVLQLERSVRRVAWAVSASASQGAGGIVADAVLGIFAKARTV